MGRAPAISVLALLAGCHWVLPFTAPGVDRPRVGDSSPRDVRSAEGRGLDGRPADAGQDGPRRETSLKKDGAHKDASTQKDLSLDKDSSMQKDLLVKKDAAAQKDLSLKRDTTVQVDTSPPPCGFVNCSGCCSGTTLCLTGDSNTACGGMGLPCQSCSASGKVCVNHACGPCLPSCLGKCMDADDGCGGTCTTNLCVGCCVKQTNVCAAGTYPIACGKTGTICKNCYDFGMTICKNGNCSAVP